MHIKVNTLSMPKDKTLDKKETHTGLNLKKIKINLDKLSLNSLLTTVTLQQLKTLKMNTQDGI